MKHAARGVGGTTRHAREGRSGPWARWLLGLALLQGGGSCVPSVGTAPNCVAPSCVAPKPPVALPREAVTPDASLTRASLTPAHTGEQLAPDGEQRLTTAIRPRRYHIALDVDPRTDSFTGITNIDVSMSQPTRRIVLHAGSISVTAADAISLAGSVHRARVEVGRHGGLALHFEEPLTGSATLRLQHEGALSEAPDSLYRVRERGKWYAFTQFEALEARSAFPCFDEPQFKTPFRIRLRVPEGMTALSNAPLSHVARDSGSLVFDFAETAPLPTYLVAFAVGEFELYSAPLLHLQHNVYTTAGKSAQAAYAAAQTGPILAALEDYFGISYPFQKLDQLAVPVFRAGAMENVGLVTYRENILLLDPKTASWNDTLISRSVVAHELAHMWFGNLVTMQWWDDVWLNEAFATWMSNKVLTRLAPELESEVWAVADMLKVMQEDALSFATPIRKQIRNAGDVTNAFDPITYQKGLAVLRMLEGWITPQAFREGVRDYLRAHQFSNATMSDFLTSLAAQTALPVAEVASGFIEQPGTPLVTLDTQCHARPSGGYELVLALSQERYVPLGVDGKRSRRGGRPWTIPMCVRLLPDTGASTVHCELLSSPTAKTRIRVSACPTAVYPNADEAGYFHWRLPQAGLAALGASAGKRLSLKERVALPRQVQALFEAGEVSLPDFLRVLAQSAKDSHRFVLSGVIAGLRLVRRVAAEGTTQAQFRQFARALLEPHVRRVGTRARPNEASGDGLLRAELFSAYGELVGDPTLSAQGSALVTELLTHPAEVDVEQLQILLPLAAVVGDKALHEKMISLLPTATPSVREALIVALGHFEEPELLRHSYDLLLDGVIRPTELWSLRRGAFSSPKRYQHYFSWLQANLERVIAVVGRGGTSHLPFDAAGHCTVDGRQRAVRLFANVERLGPGAKENLAKALEWVDRCVALRRRYGKVASLGDVFPGTDR